MPPVDMLTADAREPANGRRLSAGSSESPCQDQAA